MPAATAERPRLKQRYETELRPALQQELGLGNVMQVPRLEKIVLNCGVGQAVSQSSLLDGA
ncbi:MAG TPA: 50S ribosomal protein L5, partial [Acidimicrobiia bacterium]|nr:50S ribosomal protein L5 [Acidimicrobiia bacterium]